MKVSRLCDLFMDHAAAYYRKPSGRQTSEYALMRVSLDPLLAVAGNRPVRRVKAATLIEARKWILDHLPDNSRRTVNAKVGRMVRVFRWGADPERGYVPERVCAVLLVLKPLPYGRSSARETPGLKAVSPEVITDLLAALADFGGRNPSRHTQLARRRLATMIELQLHTGMRSGELCGMTVESIDRHGPRGVWLYRPEEHKTQHRGRERVVVLFDEAQHLLRQWLRTSGVRHGPVFGIRPDSYRTSIQRAMRRAGLAPMTPHQIRHTTATETRRAAGLEAAQALLGHASARTTEIYAGADLDLLVGRLAEARGHCG